MSNGNGIFIVAELTDNASTSHIMELVTPAKTIAQQSGQPITGVILSDGNAPSQDLASQFAEFGISNVIQVSHPTLNTFKPQLFAKTLTHLIQSKNPAVVLLSATTRAKDYAPRVALAVDGGLLSNLNEVSWANGQLQGVKGCLAESMLATVAVKPNATVQLATIKPKAYEKPATSSAGASATVETFAPNLDALTAGTQLVSVASADTGKIKLEDAEIIVSGGRGLQSADNFVLVENLAASLGAAVGASRAIVDAGWRPHSEQVGQTGKTVSPKVYVAIGISGAIQHLVGMRTSQTIIAINRDAEAPIFKVADFGIVGDALTITPKLTEAINQARLATV